MEFFPAGFWKTIALIGMILFFVLGVDLMAGARLVRYLSQKLNQKYHTDEAIVKVLSDLKKTSDREYNVDASLTTGWGRFVLSGLLIFGAAVILMNLMPRL